MATVESVFHLFDGVQCNCTSNDCCCDENRLINPCVIGRSKSKYDLKTKCYIPYLEECSIFTSEITHKKEAFLTDCGHSFHRHCLADYYHVMQKQKLCWSLSCPLCRTKLGNPVFYEKYNLYSEEFNRLDDLENFWWNEHDYTKITMCKYYNDDNHDNYEYHYLGMNNKCRGCQKYRKNGSIV